MFKARVVVEIAWQLTDAARKNKEVAVVVDLIGSEGSSDIRLLGHGSIDKTYPQKSPDAAFGYFDDQYPSVVIEHSQQNKDLTKLAEDYILGSNGNIHVVVGLDIECRGQSKRATVSTWRPRRAPDPENEAVIFLEMIDDLKADVSSISSFRIEVSSKGC